MFVIGAFCFLHALLLGRVRPRIAWPFPALAVAYAVLSALTAPWSVVPRVSLDGAVQIAAIFAGSLAFLAVPPGPLLSARHGERLYAVILIAVCVGSLVFLTDRESGFHLQAALSHRADALAETKYNRGTDYLVVLAWPALGFFCERRAWGRAVLLAVMVGAVAGLGASLAGKMAALAGLAVLLLALWLPRLVGRVLQFGIPLVAGVWPFVLRAVAVERGALGGLLKPSAVHRLEIWDYMTAHVMQRPLVGSGLLSARFLSVPPADLSHFHYVQGPGVYPHDQWLQLWVETGALGLVLGAAFAALVVGAARRLPVYIQPFAYASIAACLVVSAVNFEVTTDSWWAAIAATAFLFMILARRPVWSAGQAAPFASSPARLHLREQP